jgi:hypothetical protein
VGKDFKIPRIKFETRKQKPPTIFRVLHGADKSQGFGST